MAGVAGEGSLTYFVGDPVVNLTIMLLIIIGGLAFSSGRTYTCIVAALAAAACTPSSCW